MRESAIINEWRAEVKRDDLLELFDGRFGPAPAGFVAAVNAETDLDQLGQWFRSLVKAPSAEEFLRQLNGALQGV
ncbi:MAG: hypothetical protein M3Y56_13495 [Armatimonadota bacterium]|nr:hypothetical protein [Armatimonadota bacterium]